MNILGNANVRKATDDYWLASPSYFYCDGAHGWYVGTNGNFYSYYVYDTYGVRPTVSLSPGVEYVDGGDGSMANPYVVKMN
jgi:hypothetical protein